MPSIDIVQAASPVLRAGGVLPASLERRRRSEALHSFAMACLTVSAATFIVAALVAARASLFWPAHP